MTFVLGSSRPRALAVGGERELEDYQFYEEELREGLRKRGRGKRSKRRKAIISSLIKILLDPVSPAESEEEPEMLAGAIGVWSQLGLVYIH